MALFEKKYKRKHPTAPLPPLVLELDAEPCCDLPQDVTDGSVAVFADASKPRGAEARRGAVGRVLALRGRHEEALVCRSAG